MFNFEGRQNFAWLALPCSPVSSRVMMLLLFAALLALPIPAAQATDCVRFADGYSWGVEIPLYEGSREYTPGR